MKELIEDWREKPAGEEILSEWFKDHIDYELSFKR